MAGDEWDLDDFKLWIIDNIRAIHALYSLTTPGNTQQVNEVVIGDTGGTITGVALPNGGLLIGTAGAPIALAAGSFGQRLLIASGVVYWGAP